MAEEEKKVVLRISADTSDAEKAAERTQKEIQASAAKAGRSAADAAATAAAAVNSASAAAARAAKAQSAAAEACSAAGRKSAASAAAAAEKAADREAKAAVSAAAKTKSSFSDIASAAKSTAGKVSSYWSNLSEKMASVNTGMLSGAKSAFRGMIAAAAAFFSLRAVKQFGDESAEVSSDLTEVENVVDVSFGNMAGQADAFAEDAGRAFGISALAAKQTSSTFMAMEKGMGIAGQGAADMALNLTALSGDMSSFFNVDQAEAATALNSVFTGETETMKRFGVVMTENNLKQFAATRGMSTNIQAMSQSEQVALRYQYVMSSLSQAQGDFARTSGTWANQTRTLTQNWQNFQSVCGNIITTVLTPMLSVINAILSDMTALASVLNGRIIKMSGGIKNSTAGAGAGAKKMAAAYTDAADDIADANKKAEKSAGGLAAFDKINTVGAQKSDTSSSSSSGTAGAGAGAAGSTVSGGVSVDTSAIDAGTGKTNAFQTAADKLLKKWQQVKKVFQKAYEAKDWQPLETACGGLKDTLAKLFDWLTPKLAILSAWFLSTLLPVIMNFASAAIPLVMSVIDAVDWNFWGNLIVGFLNLMIAGIKGITKFAQEHPKIFSAIVNIILGAIVAWKTLQIVIGIVNAITGIAAAVMGLFGVSAGGAAAAETGMAAAGAAADVALLPLIATILLIVVAVALVIVAIVEVVKHWGDIKAGAKKCCTGIKEEFSGACEHMKEKAAAGASDMAQKFAGGWEKIKSGCSAFKDFIGGVFSAIPDALKAALNSAVSVINAVIAGMNLLQIDIPQWVPGIGGKHFGMSIPKIPQLADGGVLNQPTLVQAGEYAGAGRNPEIVSPESKMRSVFSEQQEPAVALLTQILSALQSINPSVSVKLGGREIEAYVSEQQKKNNYRLSPRSV